MDKDLTIEQLCDQLVHSVFAKNVSEIVAEVAHLDVDDHEAFEKLFHDNGSMLQDRISELVTNTYELEIFFRTLVKIRTVAPKSFYTVGDVKPCNSPNVSGNVFRLEVNGQIKELQTMMLKLVNDDAEDIKYFVPEDASLKQLVDFLDNCRTRINHCACAPADILYAAGKLHRCKGLMMLLVKN